MTVRTSLACEICKKTHHNVYVHCVIFYFNRNVFFLIEFMLSNKFTLNKVVIKHFR